MPGMPNRLLNRNRNLNSNHKPKSVWHSAFGTPGCSIICQGWCIMRGLAGLWDLLTLTLVMDTIWYCTKYLDTIWSQNDSFERELSQYGYDMIRLKYCCIWYDVMYRATTVPNSFLLTCDCTDLKLRNLSSKTQWCLFADLPVWPSWTNMCSPTGFSIAVLWIISFWKGIFCAFFFILSRYKLLDFWRCLIYFMIMKVLLTGVLMPVTTGHYSLINQLLTYFFAHVAIYNDKITYRPLGARMHQIKILSKLSLWVHHVVHIKIYQGKNPRVENRTFYPLFWKVNFVPDYYRHLRWEQEGTISSWCGYGCSE